MNILHQIAIVSLINFRSLKLRLWRSLVIVVGMVGWRSPRIVTIARSTTAAAAASASGTPHSFAAPA